MKYKISNVYNPYDFIKNDHIKIYPWISNGKYCIKRAPMDNGFGQYLCFPVKVHVRKVPFNNEIRTYADIYFDTDQYEWSTNDIFIVDDTIWLEAIKGGLQWFKVEEEVKPPTNGSIFLKTYPDSKISNVAYDDGICYVYVCIGGSRIRFTSDWWNAPYKAESSEIKQELSYADQETIMPAT